MQHTKYFMLACTLFFMAQMSCKKDNITTLSSIVIQGNWKVALYSDNGSDHTNHFTGYSFTFKNDGTVSAINSPNSITGTWSAGTDDSQAKMVLNFGSTDPFKDINSDWHILEKSANIIRLEDVSGGNGETELLTFEKI